MDNSVAISSIMFLERLAGASEKQDAPITISHYSWKKSPEQGTDASCLQKLEPKIQQK